MLPTTVVRQDYRIELGVGIELNSGRIAARESEIIPPRKGRRQGQPLVLGFYDSSSAIRRVSYERE